MQPIESQYNNLNNAEIAPREEVKFIVNIVKFTETKQIKIILS